MVFATSPAVRGARFRLGADDVAAVTEKQVCRDSPDPWGPNSEYREKAAAA
jgi:hypothetical protein